MKKALSVMAAAMLLAWSTMGRAGEGDVGVAVNGGTLGIGGEASVELGSAFTLRGGVNYLKFSFDSTIEDLDYTMEPEFKNGGLLLDWFPFAGAFHLTGGVYFNGNQVDVDGLYRADRIPEEYQQYSYLRDLAHVRGTVEFNALAPYLGLGWASNRTGRGWGVAVDLGVMFQGSPEVTDLRLEDPIGVGGLPEVQDFLAEQKRAIEDDLENFQYYPVATLSLRYGF